MISSFDDEIQRLTKSVLSVLENEQQGIEFEMMINGFVARLHEQNILSAKADEFDDVSLMSSFGDMVHNLTENLSFAFVPLRIDHPHPPMVPPLVFVSQTHIPQSFVEWAELCNNSKVIASYTARDVVNAIGTTLEGVSVTNYNNIVVVECNRRKGIVCYGKIEPMIVNTRNDAVRLVTHFCPDHPILFHVGILCEILDREPRVFYAKGTSSVSLSTYATQLSDTTGIDLSNLKTYEQLFNQTISADFAFAIDYNTGTIHHGDTIGLLVTSITPRGAGFSIKCEKLDATHCITDSSDEFVDHFSTTCPHGLVWMFTEWPPPSINFTSMGGIEWRIVLENEDDTILMNAHLSGKPDNTRQRFDFKFRL